MSDLAQAISARTGAPRATIDIATMVDDSTHVLVGGQSVSLAKCLSGYQPKAGDEVLIARQGSRIHVLGALVDSTPPTPLPRTGTITAIQAGANPSTVTVTAPELIQVNADGVEIQNSLTIPYLASATGLAVGDTVQIFWSGTTAIVLGKLAVPVAAPPPPAPAPAPPPAPKPPPPPPPPKPPQTGSNTFIPNWQGSFRAGVWRSDTADAVQGGSPYDPIGNNNGAWFYGGAPYNALRGATVTGAAIYLRRGNGGVFAAQAVHLSLHNAANRPAGNVGYIGSVYNVNLAVGQAGWFGLPVAWVQSIIASAAVGIGVVGTSPYVRLNGRAVDGSAGALRLDWRK